VPDLPGKLGLLELLVQRELAKPKPFRFLQLGANDGSQADPLHDLIARHRLAGVMVEPQPGPFQKLVERYSGTDHQLEFENLAIAARGEQGTLDFYHFSSPDPARQHELSGFSSVTRERLVEMQKLHSIEATIERVPVRFESVPYFLQRKKIDSLSLLVTDVEGLDCALVQATIEHGLLPAIVCMEILGEDAASRREIMQLLTARGYRIGGNLSDLIAYRDEAAPGR
jgi:FkbM family methyltransferase